MNALPCVTGTYTQKQWFTWHWQRHLTMITIPFFLELAERFVRELRVHQILEGTNQIMNVLGEFSMFSAGPGVLVMICMMARLCPRVPCSLKARAGVMLFDGPTSDSRRIQILNLRSLNLYEHSGLPRAAASADSASVHQRCRSASSAVSLEAGSG